MQISIGANNLLTTVVIDAIKQALREINHCYQGMSNFRIEAWGPILTTNTVLLLKKFHHCLCINGCGLASQS